MQALIPQSSQITESGRVSRFCAYSIGAADGAGVKRKKKRKKGKSAKHRYRPKPGRRNAQQLANAEVGASNSETGSDDG